MLVPFIPSLSAFYNFFFGFLLNNKSLRKERKIVCFEQLNFLFHIICVEYFSYSCTSTKSSKKEQ